MSKSKAISSPMNDYEADQDVSALQRAQEVQSDPKRHAKAKAHAKKKLDEHNKKGNALAMIATSKAAGKASKTFNKKKFSGLPYPT